MKNNSVNNDRLELLYQDKWLAVIYKPEGLLSVPFEGYKGKSAQSILEEMLRRRGQINAHHKPFAVHRLDRDTSGVMMFALNEPAKKKIMDNWHKMVTSRLYRALAEVSQYAKRNPLSENGLIDDPIALNAHNIGFVPKDESRKFKTMPARTNYKKLKDDGKYALFELSLDTGKKNQIRAHLAAHGYPLAGDKEHRAVTNPFGRLCLHARTLEFDHPFTHEHLVFEVPEPQEWSDYIHKC